MRSFNHILSILFLAAFLPTFGQNKSLDDLNREKAKLQSIIEQNNKLMDEYASRRNNEMMRISVVDTKISKRKSLIELYQAEIQAYNEQVVVLQHKIDSVQSEVKKQKADYAEMLRNIQARGKGYSPLAYILSSSSFNQSYRRFLFLKQYSDYRIQQFEKLNKSAETLQSLKSKVSEKLASVNNLLNQISSENNQLSRELAARKENVAQISKSQSDLKAQIEKAQAQTRKLEDQIVAIIKEEAERARREAEEQRRKALASSKSNSESVSKPKSEAEILSDDIMENKGKLPWPVRSYVVTSAFGEHDHPLVPQIKIRNNGIDMDILASKEIHPVHKGKVSRIIQIPGSSASIIIRHGNILTVYSNLSKVYVKKDQEVDVNTNLGTVFVGEGLNSNILHFEIWKDDQKQNPESWLRN